MLMLHCAGMMAGRSRWGGTQTEKRWTPPLMHLGRLRSHQSASLTTLPRSSIRQSARPARALMCCFIPSFDRGEEAIHQRPLDAVTCCPLLLLMCALLMTALRSKVLELSGSSACGGTALTASMWLGWGTVPCASWRMRANSCTSIRCCRRKQQTASVSTSHFGQNGPLKLGRHQHRHRQQHRQHCQHTRQKRRL